MVKVCTVEMPSYTYALKSEKLLITRGYECKVARKEKTSSGSCGYLLKTSGSCSEITGILENYAVPYRIISDGGA